MSYFLENEEVNEEVEEVKEQDGIASIEPLLDNRIVRAIREMGFEKLSPIQEQAIPYLLQGEDIIGQAQTGTGKTAAFGIPAIQHINPDVKKLQTIILCPTRELAIQAAEELRKIAKYMHGIKCCRSTADRISAVRLRDCGACRSSWEPRDVSWTICADAPLSWIW